MSRRGKQPTLADLQALRVRLTELLKGETDRGVALAGPAYLDHALAEMLRAYLVDDRERAGWLLGLDGPLGSFKARYHLAYCLGLIGPQMYADLEEIRKVRNDLAHSYQPVDFTSADIVDRCKRLQIPDLDDPRKEMPARDRFIKAATLLAAHCLSQIEKLKHQEVGRDYKWVVSRFNGSGVVAARGQRERERSNR